LMPYLANCSGLIKLIWSINYWFILKLKSGKDIVFVIKKTAGIITGGFNFHSSRNYLAALIAACAAASLAIGTLNGEQLT
jgi:hypothetical protein